MNQDVLLMKLAIKEALSCKEDVPVGCVITKNNNVIASSFNQREALKDPSGHAEIVALRVAAKVSGDWRLENTTMYCTLEPCAMCAEAIIQARVQRLVFGAYDSIAGAAGSAFNLFIPRRALPVPEVVGGILEEECRELLLNFFRKQRE